MEYELLSSIDKIDMINQRIFNLERHIFHNEMLLAEHDNVSLFDEQGLEALNIQIATYAAQIEALEYLKNGIQV
jgi:hypothetical protein